MGLVFDKGAVTDALNTAANDDVPDDAITHGPSPTSITRVPVHRDVDHRSTDWM